MFIQCEKLFICGRWLANCSWHTWTLRGHRECFNCKRCRKNLAEETFTRHQDDPFCTECYTDLFAKKCCRCLKPISGLVTLCWSIYLWVLREGRIFLIVYCRTEEYNWDWNIPIDWLYRWRDVPRSPRLLGSLRVRDSLWSYRIAWWWLFQVQKFWIKDENDDDYEDDIAMTLTMMMTMMMIMILMTTTVSAMASYDKDDNDYGDNDDDGRRRRLRDILNHSQVVCMMHPLHAVIYRIRDIRKYQIRYFWNSSLAQLLFHMLSMWVCLLPGKNSQLKEPTFSVPTVLNRCHVRSSNVFLYRCLKLDSRVMHGWLGQHSSSNCGTRCVAYDIENIC